jgi:hypothetical protein
MEMLISEIAYQRFLASEYFFEEDSLLKQIDRFFRDMRPKGLKQGLDPRPILNALESHLGLLVQRAMHVYSFSHLTFQEYLAARLITRKPALVAELGAMIEDPRWREVWLLLVSTEDADDLVVWIKEQLDRRLVNDAKLQDLLRWCDRKAAGIDRGTEIRSAARALYFGLAIRSEGTLGPTLDPNKQLDRNKEIILDKQLLDVVDLASRGGSGNGCEIDAGIAKTVQAAEEIACSLFCFEA